MFHTAAQDSNPGYRSLEFEALPLSHCALQLGHIVENAVFHYYYYCVPNVLLNVSQ